VWQGSAAGRLLRSRGHHALPCLGLRRRAGAAGPSPGERARVAMRGSAAGTRAHRLGTAKENGSLCPTLHPAEPWAPPRPVSHHSAAERGVSAVCAHPQGVRAQVLWLLGRTHLQVRPGLAQRVAGPGHCEGEREGVREVPALRSRPRHTGTQPARPCHPAAGPTYAG